MPRIATNIAIASRAYVIANVRSKVRIASLRSARVGVTSTPRPARTLPSAP